MGRRKPRCWMGKAEYIAELHGRLSPEHFRFIAEEEPATCLLERDHSGQHEWTFDGDITISFAPDDLD